ncbi:MAG: hypothetical protein ACREMY_01215 [bacterium]
MPRHKKPPGTAVDRRNGQQTADVPDTGAVERFEPPEHIGEAARDAWDAFWSDRPALLLTPSSRVVLVRWVDSLNRYLVTLAEADECPITTGSTGQQIVNPLYKIAEQARSTMEACEKQLGIGSLNASSLGMAAIQERKSLADMNARYSGGVSDDPTPEDDPRIVSGVRVEAD